jgi:hypothetical protein
MTVTTGVDRVRPGRRSRPGKRPATRQGPHGTGRRPASYVIVGDRDPLARGRLPPLHRVRRALVRLGAGVRRHARVPRGRRPPGAPRTPSVDAPDYDLAGQRIVLMTPEPAEREIRAVGEAVLTGDDLVLTAERIFLFARDERLDRLVALPPEVDSLPPRPHGAHRRPPGRRPHALADDFEITADSLDVLAPERASSASSRRDARAASPTAGTP